MELSPGTLLGNRYEIVRPLGRGGMAKVYLAKDMSLHGRLWAVKELNVILANREEEKEAVEQFTFEAHILTQLDHANLPKVADYFAEGGRYYLVMEYIEGVTMEDAVASAERQEIPLLRLKKWILQICDVLEYLHGRNPPVIFRDLKPANIMLTQGDDVKLIDFGIARLFLEGKEKDTMIIGTPGYAAPEQYGRGQTDTRSDIYSLGATMYFILTGEEPGFRPLNFKVPSSVDPTIPEVWDAIVLRSLSLEPGRRFQSVGEIREVLNGRATVFLDGAHVPSKVTASPEVSPVSLAFKLKSRKETGSTSLVITNSSGGVLRGNLVPDSNWVHVRPSHFRANRQQVEVTVDLYGERPAYDYAASIRLQTEEGGEDIPVSVSVNKPWFLTPMPHRVISALIMAEAFIPWFGTPLAALSYYMCERPERRRQLFFLTLSSFISMVTSALWYFHLR